MHDEHRKCLSFLHSLCMRVCVLCMLFLCFYSCLGCCFAVCVFNMGRALMWCTHRTHTHTYIYIYLYSNEYITFYSIFKVCKTKQNYSENNRDKYINFDGKCMLKQDLESCVVFVLFQCFYLCAIFRYFICFRIRLLLVWKVDNDESNSSQWCMHLVCRTKWSLVHIYFG